MDIGIIRLISERNGSTVKLLNDEGVDLLKLIPVSEISIKMKPDQTEISIRLCSIDFEVCGKAKIELPEETIKTIEALGYVKKKDSQ